MLSKELRDLEMNGIVVRTVYDTIPVTVEYELTDSGKAFTKVIDSMLEWGMQHRDTTIGERTKTKTAVTVSKEKAMSLITG